MKILNSCFFFFFMLEASLSFLFQNICQYNMTRPMCDHISETDKMIY